MISDLDDAGTEAPAPDILIIGGGTVGLLMAVRLAARGRSVLVIESGGLEQQGETHEFNEVTFERAPYAGASLGRFRCLGGSSSRWGGALIPFAAADCRRDEWPVEPAEVLRYVPAVEAVFGLTTGPYESAAMFAGTRVEFCERLAKWPPFRNRNVATLLAGQIRDLPRLRVLLNAVATDFHVADGRIASVTARARSGQRVCITAREVIFAAGAIETTRLLLLMDRQNEFRLFSQDDQLGRFFSDHLSVAVAEVQPRDRAALNMLAGFRFEPGGTMRNLRFELADASPLRASLPSCFVHIGFTDDKPGGFDALRELFRHLQRRRLPGARVLRRLAVGGPWLLSAAWWRFARQRLLYPRSSKIELHVVIEQIPRPDSRICLSRNRVDEFGLPLADISWDVDREDVANLRRVSEAFSQAWRESPLSSVALLAHYNLPDLHRVLARGGGVFHPVGSVRMGRSPEQGVVDGELRPFRVRNASIVSTAVLPRAGGANPTMMLLCLGLRCADGIDAQLGPSPSK